MRRIRRIMPNPKKLSYWQKACNNGRDFGECAILAKTKAIGIRQEAIGKKISRHSCESSNLPDKYIVSHAERSEETKRNPLTPFEKWGKANQLPRHLCRGRKCGGWAGFSPKETLNSVERERELGSSHNGILFIA
ncbi:MAG: hypothetical protein WCR42_10160 [bacterium]